MSEKQVEQLFEKAKSNLEKENYFLEINEIDLENKQPLTTIMYKPLSSNYITIVCGILFLIINKLYGYIIGIGLIILSLYILFKMKDHKTMTIYDSFILIHNPKDENKAIKVDYSQIVEWGCNDKQSVVDGMYFKTSEMVYNVETYRVSAAFNKLIDIIEDKEATRLRNKQLNTRKKKNR